MSVGDGLAAAWIFGISPYDLVQGTAGVIGGASVIGLQDAGSVGSVGGSLGASIRMESAGERFDVTLPTSQQIGQPLSLVTRCTYGSAGLTANRFGIFRNGSNYGYGVQYDGTFSIQWASGASQAGFSTGTPPSAATGLLVIRFWDTGRDVWLDGKRIDGVSGSYSDATYSGTPKLILGSSLNANFDFEYFLVYRRLLMPSEMQALVEQPYAFLHAPTWSMPQDVNPSGGLFSPFKIVP